LVFVAVDELNCITNLSLFSGVEFECREQAQFQGSEIKTAATEDTNCVEWLQVNTYLVK
jgi:hypothetical protein